MATINNGFILSNYIKVFPCAHRNNINLESRLNTEFNFTHLSSIGMKNSYVISATGNHYKVILGGYYFEFILSDDDSAYKYIGLSLKTEAIDNTLINSTLNSSTFLRNMSISDTNDSWTVLDNIDSENSYFYGVKFYQDNSEEANLDAILNFRAKKENDNGKDAFPIKYSDIDSKKHGYAISGDFYETNDAIEQVSTKPIQINTGGLEVENCASLKPTAINLTPNTTVEGTFTSEEHITAENGIITDGEDNHFKN